MLADPIDVKSGEDVTIIANPGLGTDVLDNTVTTGIISNVKRMIAGNPYIQSSAGVNPGSSGGPMFDRTGQVIGVVVLKAGIEGVGFAVPPMSIARFLLKATRHDTKQGLLERAWVDARSKRNPRRLPENRKRLGHAPRQKRRVKVTPPLRLQPRRPETVGSAGD